MSGDVDTATDQPDPKAIVGGAFSAAAETYDQVVGFFVPFGRALVAAADPDRGASVLDVACGRGDGTQTVTTTETVITTETDDAPTFSDASVPFVEGKLEALAVQELKAEDLVVRVERAPNENVEDGRVFDQSPAAGTRLAAGSEVVIYVSTG